MLTHKHIGSFQGSSNFFLCMLLLRPSEVLCPLIRPKLTNMYLFALFFGEVDFTRGTKSYRYVCVTVSALGTTGLMVGWEMRRRDLSTTR